MWSSRAVAKSWHCLRSSWNHDVRSRRAINNGIMRSSSSIPLPGIVENDPANSGYSEGCDPRIPGQSSTSSSFFFLRSSPPPRVGNCESRRDSRLTKPAADGTSRLSACCKVDKQRPGSHPNRSPIFPRGRLNSRHVLVADITFVGMRSTSPVGKERRPSKKFCSRFIERQK